ncbi:bestrophin family protein [Cesiribacter andamanensis]|uniref:Putative membrane protein n=1 Tax=Cesiribacter andamanensis AMV16 TaxID=1279009 RepID=M7NGJ1_9BACT|nr:bestrophin family ion channel [Cesiribacter andamanensis]EMR00955.1 putative membrane protein [Cesiribacter andamanensis AMV16]
MINYNPKEWFTFIFRFTKADTFRRLLPLMLAVSIYAGLVAYLELNYLNLAERAYIQNVGMMHNVLGFVISLLLVFRTNTAYDRWWEGRKVWGGMTNTCRNLAIKIHALGLPDTDRRFFRQMIPTYAIALRNSLRENEDFSEIDPILDLKPEKHLPNQLAARIYQRINQLYTSNTITSAQLWVLNEEAKSLTDLCGAAERIKNTPIPFTYSVFIKKFIFFYVMTLPFGWVFSLGYFIIPVVVFILYALASLELIAEEIENPFGTDANDLPLDQICHNIKKHVGELLADSSSKKESLSKLGA